MIPQEVDIEINPTPLVDSEGGVRDKYWATKIIEKFGAVVPTVQHLLKLSPLYEHNRSFPDWEERVWWIMAQALVQQNNTGAYQWSHRFITVPMNQEGGIHK